MDVIAHDPVFGLDGVVHIGRQSSVRRNEVFRSLWAFGKLQDLTAGYVWVHVAGKRHRLSLNSLCRKIDAPVCKAEAKMYFEEFCIVVVRQIVFFRSTASRWRRHSLNGVGEAHCC